MQRVEVGQFVHFSTRFKPFFWLWLYFPEFKEELFRAREVMVESHARCIAEICLPRLPENEQDRVAALHSFNILDTSPEGRHYFLMFFFGSNIQTESFDEITSIVAQICGLPIAYISLVDSDRIWSASLFSLWISEFCWEMWRLKSKVGLDIVEIPRDVCTIPFFSLAKNALSFSAFCAHALHQHDDVFVVEDALADSRFKFSPLVLEKKMRFYASAVGFFATFQSFAPCLLFVSAARYGTFCLEMTMISGDSHLFSHSRKVLRSVSCVFPIQFHVNWLSFNGAPFSKWASRSDHVFPIKGIWSFDSNA